jgi:hypothetical protein
MGPTNKPKITGVVLCHKEDSGPCIKSAKRMGQNGSWGDKTAQLLDLTTSPVGSDGEWAWQLVCRYNKTKCGTLHESGSPDTQPVSSDELNKLGLYSCVDPRNISGFSRGKAVVDGRIIHVRLCNEQSLIGAGFSPRRPTVYLKLPDTRLYHR